MALGAPEPLLSPLSPNIILENFYVVMISMKIFLVHYEAVAGQIRLVGRHSLVINGKHCMSYRFADYS